MKEKLPMLAGALLGLVFVVFGLNFFLGFIAMPAPPEGSPPALFFAAVGPTGFMAGVKVLEILGGILVAIPKTRNFGLLVLGPIVINILGFNLFLIGGQALFQPPVILVSALSAYLLWDGRKKFLALLN